MKQINNIIQALQSTSSTKAKAQILVDSKDVPFLRDYLYAVYNPRINYYFTGLTDWVHEPKYCMDGPITIELTYETFTTICNTLSKRILTGHAARDMVRDYFNVLDDDGRELLTYLFLRDVRAGVSTSTINKAFPSLIPKIPYMRCNLLGKVDTTDWPWETGVFLQKKMDGMFSNVQVGDVQEITSRSGSQFPIEKFKNILDGLQAVASYNDNPNLVFMGELLVKKDRMFLPREIGNGMFNAVLQGGDFEGGCFPYFVFWDVVTVQEFVNGKSEITYRERLSVLKHMGNVAMFDASVAHSNVVHSMEEANRIHGGHLVAKEEGSILKHPDMLWKSGDSNFQLKMKIEAQCELKVVGFRDGNGKNADMFGSIIFQSSCGQLDVGVSGISDKMRKEIHNNREQYLDKIATITFNAIMEPGESNPLHSLFLPRFTEWRLDKTEADDLETIFDIVNNLIAGE
jgi:DNA ligase-1